MPDFSRQPKQLRLPPGERLDPEQLRRYERFMDIDANAAELARRINRARRGGNFTGTAKYRMATYYARQDTFGNSSGEPMFTDAFVDECLQAYGSQAARRAQEQAQPRAAAPARPVLTTTPPVRPLVQLSRQRQTRPTNCFQACVASFLRIPIEKVPDACDGASWDFLAFQKWLLARHGLQAIEILLLDDETGKMRERMYPTAVGVPCIITGPSPRPRPNANVLHAVLARFSRDGFELEFDPHESDAFLAGEPTHAMFFVRVAPPVLQKDGD